MTLTHNRRITSVGIGAAEFDICALAETTGLSAMRYYSATGRDALIVRASDGRVWRFTDTVRGINALVRAVQSCVAMEKW